MITALLKVRIQFGIPSRLLGLTYDEGQRAQKLKGHDNKKKDEENSLHVNNKDTF